MILFNITREFVPLTRNARLWRGRPSKTVTRCSIAMAL